MYTQSDPEKAAVFGKGLDAQVAMLDEWLDHSAETRGVHDFQLLPPWHTQPDASRVPVRTAEFGPLTYQSDDVLLDRLGSERVGKIKLLAGGSNRLFRAQDQGELYAYEIVNFVDGKRSVGEIRDAVAAEFGPIPLDVVADYLKACEEAKLVALR
jgi:hypothetical protein